MISNERAEQILQIFQCEPGDVVKFIVDRKLTNKELEYLLQHGQGSEEAKGPNPGNLSLGRA